MPSVIENFLNPLQSQFLVPSALDPDLFAADLSDALSGYSDYQLIEAARWLKHNRAHRTFPTIAECRQACERFTSAAQAVVRSVQTDEQKRSEAIQQRLREQDAVRLCRDAPLAEQAHREGWLQTLLEFVEDRTVLPNEFEARRLKAKSAAVDANLHSLKPKFVPDAVGLELERLKDEAARYKVLCNCRRAMKERAATRLWGEPVVDVANDRRRAISERFSEFKRRFG